MHTLKTTIDTKQFQFEVNTNNQAVVSFPSHYEQKAVENALLKCIKGCHLQGRLDISTETENGLVLITKTGMVEQYLDVLKAHIHTNYPEQLLLDFGFASQAIENIKQDAEDCYQMFKDIVYCIKNLNSGLYCTTLEKNEIIAFLCQGNAGIKCVWDSLQPASISLTTKKLIIPPTMVYTIPACNNQTEGDHEPFNIEKFLDIEHTFYTEPPANKSVSPKKPNPLTANNNTPPTKQHTYKPIVPKPIPLPLSLAVLKKDYQPTAKQLPVTGNRKNSTKRAKPVKRTFDSTSIDVNVINEILPRDQLNLKNTCHYFHISMDQQKILENIDKNTLNVMGIIKIRKQYKGRNAEVIVNCATYNSWSSSHPLPATKQTPSITQPGPLSHFSHFRVSLQSPQPGLSSICSEFSFSRQ